MTHQSLLFERDRRLAGLVVGDAARLILVLVVAVSRMRRRPGGCGARATDTCDIHTQSLAGTRGRTNNALISADSELGHS